MSTSSVAAPAPRKRPLTPSAGGPERWRVRHVVSTSQWVLRRLRWQIEYTGKKPRDAALREEIAKFKARVSCNLQSDAMIWQGHIALLEFKRPIEGGAMYKLVRKILERTCASSHPFEEKRLSFSFAPGEEAHDDAEAQGRAAELGSSAAGPASSVGTVPDRDWRSAGGSEREEAAFVSRLRFKALQIARQCETNPPESAESRPEALPPGRFALAFAHHDGLQKEVAVKTVRLADPLARSFLFEEMEALLVGRRHPCVLTLLDIFCAVSEGGVEVLCLAVERLGVSLEDWIQNSRERSPTGLQDGPAAPWPPAHQDFQAMFRGLWSALAYLAGHNLAHSDIRPSNICVCLATLEAAGETRLVFCGFGRASMRERGCWSPAGRGGQPGEGAQVGTLAYRAPELLAGAEDYGVEIDVWSLGVVMTEAAGKEWLFRKCASAPILLQHLGLLEPADQLPQEARVYLGIHGASLLCEAAQREPSRRITAASALEHQFFVRELRLRPWPQAAEASAASEDANTTVLEGDRGPCQLAVGALSPDVLAELSADPYFDYAWGFQFNDPPSCKATEAQRMKVEKAADKSAENAKMQKYYVKLQVGGYCGVPFRKSCNTLDHRRPFPLISAAAWLEAFKRCNEPIWAFLDDSFRRGPLATFPDNDLGKAGKELLTTPSRQWFGESGSLQITRLHKHQEDKHHDGGAAIMLLVLTLAGRRRVTFWPKDGGKEETFDNEPGTVYLTSACGILHQVSYDGTSEGHFLPDLGMDIPVGLSVVWRTSLWRTSPYTKSRPGPEPVWKEFNRVLREMHDKFRLVLPTLGGYRDAYRQVLRETQAADPELYCPEDWSQLSAALSD